MTARTSQSHPLQIAEVRASPNHGRIGITFCPGKQDAFALSGSWARDLAQDLDAISAWGANVVVTLVEPAELQMLKVPNLGKAVHARGMLWLHLPIADYSIPDAAFEQLWVTRGRELRTLLRHGESVLLHCKGGLGRAGMMAARLLVELGMAPEVAIRNVRRARKGAIETAAQLALVRRTVAIPDTVGGQLPLIDTSRMQRIGGQLGSNPAGIYQDANGCHYYVKTLDSPAHVRNELIAARLYQLAGAPTLTYLDTTEPEQIATLWLPLAKSRISQFNEEERKLARLWFGVHAWTANWDAAGFNGDNQGIYQGKILTLDMGGALAFRAHGDPKGHAFGSEVNELDTLRSDKDNPYAITLFGNMSSDEINTAIAVVVSIPDEQIRQVILDHGGPLLLADKMIARKQHMAQRLAH